MDGRKIEAVTEGWASTPAVRAAMQGNHGRDTRPEMRVRALLHAAGLRYRVNLRPLAAHRFSADLVFTRSKVAVFIDGCFWHGCPEHLRPARTNAAFWAQKITANQERDARAEAALVKAGWLALRFWEHEDPAEVAKAIACIVRERRMTTPNRLGID